MGISTLLGEGFLNAQYTQSFKEEVLVQTMNSKYSERSNLQAVWRQKPFNLESVYYGEFEFRFRVGCTGTEQDRVIFIMQQDGIHALSKKKKGLGIEGINPKFAIIFDSFKNKGTHSRQRNKDNIASVYLKGCPEDYYHAIIKWYNRSNRLEVWINDTKKLVYKVDIPEAFFDGDPTVYWGFAYFPELEEEEENYVDLEDEGINKDLANRKIKEGKQYKVRNNHLKIQLWDSEEVDGDIISLYLNGKWILREHKLKRKKKQLKIKLKKGQENHLILFAHNEGKRPPNTAAVRIKDGKRTIQTNLRSNLKSCDHINLIVE